MAEIKWKSIPPLTSYRVQPPESFWENFPKRGLAKGPKTPVNINELTWTLDSISDKLTTHENRRHQLLINDLKNGGKAYQKVKLPGTTVPNTESALEHGRLMTDKVVSWIKEGFLLGPFDTPPLPGFRANALMAVVRDGKVRPVINMSSPHGNSFNENVMKNQIEKVKMSTAQEFSYKVRALGKGATMTKFDLRDAYKIIPARKEDWRLQGIKWLGKYFLETQMIFGATTSVSNFDRLGRALVEISVLESKVPRSCVFRTLDDIPVISAKGTGHTESFTNALENLCFRLNLKLAEPCPKLEKAFKNSTKGVVLGVGFNTETTTWYYTREKSEKIIRRCLDIVHGGFASLKQIQKVAGSVNSMTQMCPFLKPYQWSCNRFLASFGGDEEAILPVPETVKNDLLVAAKVAKSAENGLPICERPGMPPLKAIHIYSDAAGASFTMVNGKRVLTNKDDKKGIACIACDETGRIFWFTRLFWPKEFIETARDSNKFFYGSKSTTLESFGLILPMLHLRDHLTGHTLVYHFDNIAVAYGWRNGGIKFDETASIIVRTAHLLAKYIGARIHVRFNPRRSCDKSILVDNLSRESTTPTDFLKSLPQCSSKWPRCNIESWLEEPTEDWELPNKILNELENFQT